MTIVLAVLFGLLIGSFLNVCIYRLPRDLSVVHPRSHCPHCERLIAAYDNIPLLSFLLLRGRCRHCGVPIPWRYPLVEAVTGALFGLAIVKSGGVLDLAAIKLCVYAALMVGLIMTDWETFILPDEFTLGGTALGIAFAYGVPFEFGLANLFLTDRVEPRWLSVANAALAAWLAAGLVWGIRRAYELVRRREGMGLGDVKLVALIAAFGGFRGFALSMLLGSLAGSVLGLLYARLKGEDTATFELPFGSFLGVAALLVAYLGPPELF